MQESENSNETQEAKPDFYTQLGQALARSGDNKPQDSSLTQQEEQVQEEQETQEETTPTTTQEDTQGALDVETTTQEESTQQETQEETTPETTETEPSISLAEYEQLKKEFEDFKANVPEKKR